MTTNAMMRRRNLQVTEQLLAELQAGRFDSGLTKRIVDGTSAFPHLLRAVFLAEQGRLALARADVSVALELDHGNPVIAMVAGLVYFATRDYQRALDSFARAARHSPAAARRARQMAITAAGALGWEHDVRELLDAAIAAERDHASWHVQAVRLFVRGRWWERALVHARAGLALEPANPSLWMETAGLLATLDRGAEAIAAVDRALTMAPVDSRIVYLREAGRVAIEASDFARSLACFREALALDPNQPDVWVRLAEIASWQDRVDEAREAALRALELGPCHAGALRLLGGLEARAGNWDAAIELLERAIESDPKEYQAYVWLSEVYLRTARYELAHAQLHSATMNSGGFLFVAWLLRFLIVAYEKVALDLPVEPITPNRTEEFEDALRELVPDLAERARISRTPADTVAAVEAGLAALRANRSISATHMVGDRLVRLRTRTGCRHESRWALQLLRVAPPDVCLAQLDAVVAKYPGTALALCHRGELHLWLGNWDRARADLEHAIQIIPGTRWAYMGLSTLELLAGDPEGSLATNAHGVEIMNRTEGPAIHVFRGEAKRKLGRIAEALAELELAVERHPARASGAINLALAHAANGDLESARRLWQRLSCEQAPGLMSDAAAELGVAIFGDPGWEPELDVTTRVLDRALTMMGANRSSGLLTYWTEHGQLRFVPLWPHGGRGPHERDPTNLARAKTMLLRALASYSGPSPAR